MFDGCYLCNCIFLNHIFILSVDLCIKKVVFFFRRVFGLFELFLRLYFLLHFVMLFLLLVLFFFFEMQIAQSLNFRVRP